MRSVVQRVNSASVTVDGEAIGKIGKGLLVLLGVCDADTEADMKWLADKIAGLRIFTDENDKMNLSIRDVGGNMLIVSQFTLLADTSHGNRPSFIGAGSPAHAKRLYEYFVELVRSEGIHAETGEFGAHMEVSLLNNGPVTLILNSANYKK